MTDNTQVGLNKLCEAFIDGDISAGQFKRAVRIWHNKQVEEAMAKFHLKKNVKYDVKASDSVIVITHNNKLKDRDDDQL